MTSETNPVPGPNPNDEELMTAYAREGSTAAFSTLYQRYEGRLYSFLLRRLSPDLRPIAPDLFQKIWLKLHGARRQYDGSLKFAPWLFTIARNTLKDEWRVPRIFDELDDVADLQTATASDSVEAGFVLKEDLQRLERALSRIPVNQREALILTEWEGFTSKELAQTLGISEAAARQVVSRARKKVRQMMQEDQA